MNGNTIIFNLAEKNMDFTQPLLNRKGNFIVPTSM